MPEFSLSDDQPVGEDFSLTDEKSAIVPNNGAVDRRAQKANYALAENSPGFDTIQKMINQGEEQSLRDRTAMEEDQKNQEFRYGIITALAKQNGGSLSPEAVDVVRQLSAQDLRNDPASILEKKFSDRYIASVLAQQAEDSDQIFDKSLKVRDLTTDIQVLHRIKDDLESKWQQQGWWDWGTSQLGQLVPYLPWWRQAGALENRPNAGAFGMGQSMRENVSYWWTLPPERRMAELQKAIQEFEKKGQLADAMTFVNSLISFPASDEFLANAVSLADYTTGASMWGKLLTKVLPKGAEVAATAAKEAEAAKALTGPGNALPKQDFPAMGQQQLDLFPDSPLQGSFRFMTPGTQQLVPEVGGPAVSPTGLVRNPRTGQMTRATTRDAQLANGVTVPKNTPEVQTGPRGEFRDAQSGRFGKSTEVLRQQDLPLGRPDQQPDLFRSGPDQIGTSRGLSIQEKYNAAGRTPRDPNNDLPNPPSGGSPPPPPRGGAGGSAADRAKYEASLKVEKALGDAVKAVSDPTSSPQEVLSQMGQIKSAATLGVLERLKKGHITGLADLAKEIPSFANPMKFYESSKLLSRELTQRLVEQVTGRAGTLIDTFNDAARPVRLPDAALKVAIDQAQNDIRKEFPPTLKSGAMEVEYLPAEANIWGNDSIIGWVGKNDATAFSDEIDAKKWARDVYKLEGNYRIEQRGNGWMIGVYKHLDETNQAVRDAMTLGAENKTTGGIVKMWLNRLMGADNLLPSFQRAARKVSQHAPQEVRAQIVKMVENDIYKPLSKKELKGLDKVLIENRDGPSKVLPGERGFWHETAADFEEAYLRHNGEYPRPEVTKAYDTFRRANDLDWLFRNVMVYRDKARRNAEQFRFRGEGGSTNWFEGAKVNEIPFKEKYDAGVFIYNTETKTGDFRYMHDFNAKHKEELQGLLDKGYRIVQVVDPEKKPLNHLATRADGQPLKEQINYVVTNSWERQPLSWKQVDYRAGGHVVYPGRWFIAQPQIAVGAKGALTYFGDSNILNVMTRAEASKWADRLDTLRVMLKGTKGWTPEAEAYIKENLPYSKDQINALFFHNNAPLSLDHPVTFKESGYNTIDTVTGLRNRYPNLVDNTRNPHDLTTTIDKAYLTDRDNIIKTVEENGMLSKLVDAEQLDPYDAMNRAMGQALRGIWMKDYQITAAESFLRDFSDVLKPRQEQLDASPLHWLYNPEYIRGADQTRLALAKASNRAVLNFIGHQTELGRMMTYTNEKLMSTIYNTTGQAGVKAMEKVGNFTDRIGLGNIKDPVQFMRAVAFHTNLGLFNPVQLMVQIQSLAHVAGVAGMHNAIPGVAAAFMARVAAHNPDMIPHLAKKAGAFGWKEADFKEMMEGLRSSGLANVAGEAVLRDDAFDPKIFKSAGQSFLDKGAYFFNEGERFVRLSAFSTAYREWKKAGGKALTDRELAKVVERADTLSVNMTRASSASWQTGILSVPTQFFAFNARLLEQFLGKRLTNTEKVRALATYSGLYGIPVTAGIYTMGTSPIPGVPTSYEDIKQYAMQQGWDMSPAYIEALQKGLLSMALHYATGREYNIPERYGPGASTALSNILREDKGYLEIALGASGSILADMWKTADPFLYHAASVFNKNSGEYPLTASDLSSVIRNIKSVDNLSKAYDVLKYGEWITKNGVIVTQDVTSMDAVAIMAGLSPTKVTDTYAMLAAGKEEDARQKRYMQAATQNWKMGMEAASRGQNELAQTYFTRAHTASNFADLRVEEQNRAFANALRQTQDLSQKVQWDFFKNAPRTLVDPRLQQYIRNQQAR